MKKIMKKTISFLIKILQIAILIWVIFVEGEKKLFYLILTWKWFMYGVNFVLNLIIGIGSQFKELKNDSTKETVRLFKPSKFGPVLRGLEIISLILIAYYEFYVTASILGCFLIINYMIKRAVYNIYKEKLDEKE
jgi:hypothetical protein